MEDQLFFGGAYRIGNSCIAVCSAACDSVRVCVQPPILMITSDRSGDGNVRTLFITDPLLSSRDNFSGYRDRIAAAIHYAEYPLTCRTCNGEIKKTRNIYDCEISACTFRIKRLRGQSGYYEMLFNPTLFILRFGLERRSILEITERKNASWPNVRGGRCRSTWPSARFYEF